MSEKTTFIKIRVPRNIVMDFLKFYRLVEGNGKIGLWIANKMKKAIEDKTL